MKFKIAYFGTPDFSARFLEKIILDAELDIEIVLVVTQPDKPVGRKQILTPSPVKLMAQKHNIEIFDQSLSHQPSILHTLLSNIDLCVLFAYGEIIPKSLLEAPRLGFWNIHPSLLPLYRGASPIVYPLILGDTKTGVTLMQMGEKLDDGPIISQQTYEIQASDTRQDLEIKLTDMGFEIFKQAISNVIPADAGIHTNRSQVKPGMTVIMTPQNDSQATYTRRLTKQDGFIPLSILKKALINEQHTFDELPELIKEYYSRPTVIPNEGSLPGGRQVVKRNSSKIIYDYFRGLSPWPGIWTKITIDGVEKRLKITDMIFEESKLSIQKVQLEGKQEMDFDQLKNQFNLNALS